MCRAAPVIVTLKSQINAMYPFRDISSDGVCGDSRHQATNSDHNPRQSGPAKGYALAVDLDEDVAPGLDLKWLRNQILSEPDWRLNYWMYEGEIAKFRDGKLVYIRATTSDQNPHPHHMHLSFYDAACFDTTPITWFDYEEPAVPDLDSQPMILHFDPTGPGTFPGRLRYYTLDVENQNLLGWNGADIDWPGVQYGFGLAILSITNAFHPQGAAFNIGSYNDPNDGRRKVAIGCEDSGVFLIPMK